MEKNYQMNIHLHEVHCFVQNSFRKSNIQYLKFRQNFVSVNNRHNNRLNGQIHTNNLETK